MWDLMVSIGIFMITVFFYIIIAEIYTGKKIINFNLYTLLNNKKEGYMAVTKLKKIKYSIDRGLKVLDNHECSRCFHILSNREDAFKRSWIKNREVFETEIVCKKCFNKNFNK